jgi:exodeoxyribonuclease-5
VTLLTGILPVALIAKWKGSLFTVSYDGFSLIKHPDYKLTKIHRQEEGNPIIDISMKVREFGRIDHGCYSNKVFKVKSNDKITRHIMENSDFMNQNIIMLTNSNRDRRLMNEYVRMSNNFTKNILYPGEKIVCLNNNYHYGCMNGEIYTVLWVMECNKELYEIVVTKEGESDLLSILAYKKSFGLESYDSLHDDCNKLKNYYYKNKKMYKDILSNDFVCFDYGYALSVHKSQGSSWEKVILFERRNKYQDDDNYKRWLYTGVTRAEKSLLIIDGQYYTD